MILNTELFRSIKKSKTKYDFFKRSQKASFIEEYFLNIKMMYSMLVANTLCHGESLEALLL